MEQKRSVRRLLLVVGALALLAVVTAGGTLAYIATVSQPVSNQFTPAQASIEVQQDTGSIQHNITVSNTGTAYVYVRVALVSQTMAENGTDYTLDDGAALQDLALNYGWALYEGYYYYTQPLAPGQTTPDLLASALVSGDDQTVVALAQCVQSEPVDAVMDAWGVYPAALG